MRGALRPPCSLSNLVPLLALQAHDQESFDLDEEEPNLEPAWPHLQVSSAPWAMGHGALACVWSQSP